MTNLQQKLRHMWQIGRILHPKQAASGQSTPRVSLRAESEADSATLLQALAARSLTTRRFHRV